MKTIYLSLFAALMLVGCVDKVENVIADKLPKAETFEVMADFMIPVQQDKASIVMIGDDTLAVTRRSEMIPVPRAALAAGEVKVSYSADAIYNTIAWSKYWQYISFEDSRLADYDYNDLVIHCRVKSQSIKFLGNDKFLYSHTIWVQPVALGGSRPLKLGVLYKDSAESEKVLEKIICEDVRAQIFGGNSSFPINTDPTREIKQVNTKLTQYLEVQNYDPSFKVAWFIETGTDRFYAVTTNFDVSKSGSVFSNDGFPYGIILTKTWDYPIEKVSIRDAYPGFDDWIKTGVETTLLKNSVKGKIFPAGINGLWNYDN